MPRPGHRNRRVAAAVLLAAGGILVSSLAGPATEDTPRQPTIEPIEVDLTERTERTLLLLDVEAVDKQGQPLPGLKKEDFKIRVNYAWRKIYSVDDLCPCGDAAPDPDNPPSDPAEAARLAVIQAPPHFILYFDYSQLGTKGRLQAVEEARRWAAEVMRPEDRVMVAAYATDAGLRRLSDFTDDTDEVLRAIDAGAALPEMQDPFPARLGNRKADCATGTLSCSHTGRKEYFHARRSMETFRNFLTDLDEIPERKTILLFHQNASMFPGRMYGGAPAGIPQSIHDEIRGYDSPFDERLSRMRGARGWVPDLLELEEELGGAATASRSVVYPILCGSTGPWNVNFGANLADQTGGETNRRLEDLRATLGEAGRRCPCVYRIGLELPGKDKSFVLRTKIKVRGEPLPSRYRVEHLTDGDRWMRKAQLVMANPEAWADLAVRAAVIPLRTSGNSWDVSIQMAVDLSTLTGSPTGEHDGEWEVAALLGDEEFRETREMLGVFRARSGDKEHAAGVVLHERVIEGLRPGRYELRCFARDRETNRFGGARFGIDLPVPGQGGLSGPVMLQPETWHFRSALPMRKDKRPEATETTPRRRGPLPFGERAVVRSGEPVRFIGWYCSENSSSLVASVRRQAGESWTFRPEQNERSGPCVNVSSLVDTDRLPPGEYVYELGTGAPAPVGASFEVLARD